MTFSPHLRIGFDFDDVLISTVDCAVKLYNKKHNTRLANDNWYDFSDLSVWGAVSISDITSRLIEVIYSEEFNNIVKPILNSQKVLAKLKEDGHLLFIITGRPISALNQTRAILDRYYPSTFNNNHVYFTDNFSVDGEKTTKDEIIRTLNLNYFIDDHVEHVNNVNRLGVRTILFDNNYAWNKIGFDKEVIRLSNWQDIGNFIDRDLIT